MNPLDIIAYILMALIGLFILIILWSCITVSGQCSEMERRGTMPAPREIK